MRYIPTISLFLSLLITFSNISYSKGWDHLTTEGYIQKRVACEQLLLNEKWSRTNWPVENSKPKPKREDLFSDEAVKAKVINNLRMESALKQLMGIQITTEKLQSDIDRIVKRTKNQPTLRRIFEQLNNDPRTIAECLSRPNLVRDQLSNNYWMDAQIHRDTLDKTDKHGSSSVAQLSQKLIFKETRNTLIESSFLKKNRNHAPVEVLSPSEFKLTFNSIQADSSKIIEDRKYFLQRELLTHKANYMIIKISQWPKQSFEDWWFREAASQPIHSPKNLQAELRLIPPESGASHIHSKTQLVDVWQTPDIPTARIHHTAVWTGTEMLIWGGQESSSSAMPTKTGSRYNPITDTWVAMTSVNAPIARSRHTAIWTGSEMIIWGGLGGDHSNDILNTGSKYNPVSDSWEDISLDNVISSRSRHRAIWSGNKMLVWGGQSNEGGLYNPTTDQWHRMNIIGAPFPRHDPSVIWTGSKMIVWGGGRNNSLFNSGGIYDLASDSWSSMNQVDAPSPRTAHAAVWASDKMMVWGGKNGSNTYYRNGKIYHPDSDTWNVINEDINPPYLYRFGDKAIWTGDKMLLWQGYQTGVGALYDPVTDSWTLISTDNSPEQRTDYSMVWTGSEMMVWGGYKSKLKETGGIYNVSNDSWIQMKSRQEPMGGSVLWTGAEMLVWGDSFNNYGQGAKYDPVLDQWHPISNQNAPTKRESHELVWTGTEMIAWGGIMPLPHSERTNGRYEPMSNTWTLLTTVDEPEHYRKQYSAVWSGENLLVWGGRFVDNLGAIYDPLTDIWSPMSTINAPSERSLHSTVWTGSEMIVWGGVSGSNDVNNGGKYNPKTNKWQSLSLINTPSHRNDHAAIWTGDEMIITGGDVSGSYNSGRYDPVKDSWDLFSGDIEYREGHVAFWTGRSILTWGGIWSTSHDDTPGSIFLMDKDEWQNMSLENQPHTSGNNRKTRGIWTGHNMMIWDDRDIGTNLKIYQYTKPDLIFITGFEE